MNLTVIILLLAGLVVSAAVCVVIRNLLKAAIALAVTSAILSVIMFVLGAPLAAVFELSVCAGLITVIFISAISMTRVHSRQEQAAMQKARYKRFALLPVVLVAVLAVALALVWPHVNALLPYTSAPSALSAQDIFWNKRQVDLIGQIIIILAGVFGVIVFFKEDEAK